MDYDVIFIGSGHACNHGAMALSKAGKKVAIIEQDKNGGTCTNYGCNAKIILDGPFEYREGIKRYSELGIETPSVQWKPLMEYKRQVLAPLDEMVEQVMFKGSGVEEIRGRGRLLDKNTVEVNGKNYTADYIVIGSGARSAKLNIIGQEFTHDSRDFLDLDEMPERIVFIGAGIVSMEFACMALDLGKQVTVIEFAPRALAAYPKKYVDTVVSHMEELGAKFIFGQGVASVEKTEHGYCVKTADGFTAEADYVLDATGRIANIEDLGLEALGIEASRRGIKVDDHMRTSVPNIFASGDVVDKSIPKLTPTAEFESNYIADLILGKTTAPISYPVIPNLVFTLPRIAQVGVSVNEALAQPEKYRVAEIPFNFINEVIDNREFSASHTYIIDREGHLAGAAIYRAEAGTLIDFLTLIINAKLTGSDLQNMIFAFPTPTYSLLAALIPLLSPI